MGKNLQGSTLADDGLTATCLLRAVSKLFDAPIAAFTDRPSWEMSGTLTRRVVFARWPRGQISALSGHDTTYKVIE